MKTLCIVPCGKAKIWDKNENAGATKARNVYIGPFATKCREYAEKFFPSSWCILSAKYGFLFPDDIISENYNVSFKHKKTNPINNTKLSEQVSEKELDKYEQLVILGGKEYFAIAEKVFHSKKIVNPLRGCKRNGEMMSKIKKWIKDDNKGF